MREDLIQPHAYPWIPNRTSSGTVEYDNRNSEQMLGYLESRIECLKRERERLEQRVLELEREVAGLKGEGC